MFPGNFATSTPDKPAAILAETGERITYAELDERSLRLAHYFRDRGLQRGDCVAMISPNRLEIFEIYWAAMRSGLYITFINYHLTAAETSYIVTDCGAKVLFAAEDCAAAVADTGDISSLIHRVSLGDIGGFDSYAEILASSNTSPLADQPRGQDMLYSSGTTGRPKGIRPPLQVGQVDEIREPGMTMFVQKYEIDSDTVYLSPAPLYHAAPLRFCGVVQEVGGTAVVMKRFDPEGALRLIDTHQITHSQWVPTMFVRMLKLPTATREKYDVSSMRYAIHAAAPCPVHVKREMIQWWGPVIEEYYSSTEAVGATVLSSAEALAHPGSVGRPVVGIVHICDDAGNEVPTGVVGDIYFERDTETFRYHHDPAKTRAGQHRLHPRWVTTGDIGYVDPDEYLYITDRAAFMIISGGVNIYPQEAENVLIGHRAVSDVAVIGVADDDLGQSAKACIQLAEGTAPSDELTAELDAFVRKSLASYKAPRSYDFVAELPRTETGKLVKRVLQQRYT